MGDTRIDDGEKTTLGHSHLRALLSGINFDHPHSVLQEHRPTTRHLRESGDPAACSAQRHWIPASTGMTEFGPSRCWVMFGKLSLFLVNISQSLAGTASRR